MRKLFRRRLTSKKGLPPGSLVYTGDIHEEFLIELIQYTEEKLEEKQCLHTEEVLQLLDPNATAWINVVGLHNVKEIENFGKALRLHPLVIEDILNVHQRPKVEYYDSYIFVVLKVIRYDAERKQLDVEQVSFIYTKNLVVTFQERKADVWEPIRERIRASKGNIRKKQADYLLYTLIDAVVDHYFEVLEQIGEKIEEIEDQILQNSDSQLAQDIHEIKRELIVLRKSIWPLREVLSSFYRDPNPLIHPDTQLYFRDVYDHSIQVIDTVETMRDLISGILDVYLSSVSNRMNEIMKVLTIIATIFIPLTFIVGIYGMNFEYMPELHWKWGYPAILMLMAIIAIGMLFYFRRKKWI